MKKRLKFLLTVTLTLITMPLWAGNGQPCVVVEHADGSLTEYLLADNPRISYSGNMVQVITTSLNVEMAVADVKKVYLVDQQGSGIDTARRAVRISITADGLELNSLEPGSRVSVSTLDGRLLSSGRATEDGSLQLPLNNVLRDVIIVRTSNESFKLIKK